MQTEEQLRLEIYTQLIVVSPRMLWVECFT